MPDTGSAVIGLTDLFPEARTLVIIFVFSNYNKYEVMFRYVEQISASKKSMHIRKCCSYIPISVQSKFKVKKSLQKLF